MNYACNTLALNSVRMLCVPLIEGLLGKGMLVVGYFQHPTNGGPLQARGLFTVQTLFVEIPAPPAR